MDRATIERINKEMKERKAQEAADKAAEDKAAKNKQDAPDPTLEGMPDDIEVDAWIKLGPGGRTQYKKGYQMQQEKGVDHKESTPNKTKPPKKKQKKSAPSGGGTWDGSY